MPSWFFVRCGDAVKEIYHSVFMQHVVFGIPMQDVQQKPLYAPGTPRKVLGRGGGCLINDRKSVTWGEGNYTREAQKSFFSAFLHRTLGWSTIIRAWLHCCMTHTCTLDGFFFHNHYDLLGINSALQHHFQTFTVNQWQLDDNFGMASN